MDLRIFFRLVGKKTPPSSMWFWNPPTSEPCFQVQGGLLVGEPAMVASHELIDMQKSSCFQSTPNDQTCLERWRYLKWWTRRRLKSARLKSWFFLGQLFDDMMIWLYCFLYCLHKLDCIYMSHKSSSTRTLAPRHRQDLLDGLASVVKEVGFGRKKIFIKSKSQKIHVWYNWPIWMFGLFGKCR